MERFSVVFANNTHITTNGKNTLCGLNMTTEFDYQGFSKNKCERCVVLMKHEMIKDFVVDGANDGFFIALVDEKNVDAVENILIGEGYEIDGVDYKADEQAEIIVYKG